MWRRRPPLGQMSGGPSFLPANPSIQHLGWIDSFPVCRRQWMMAPTRYVQTATKLLLPGRHERAESVSFT